MLQDQFLDLELVRDMQKELDNVIEIGISNINDLIKTAEQLSAQRSSGKETVQKLPRPVHKSVEEIDDRQTMAFSKRRGKRSVVSEAIASGLLSPQQLNAIKDELRKEMKADMVAKDRKSSEAEKKSD